MSTPLCKLKKQLLQDDFGHYAQLVSCPQHVCTKCGRAANASANLCEPRPIHAVTPTRGKRGLIHEILALREAERTPHLEQA